MDSVGGYRLVRKLGEGERAEVFLGHAGSNASPRPDRTAAIKLYRASTPLISIDTEIEALARVSARHVLELRDLAIGADGRPCLILPRLGGASLGRVLAGRSAIDAGEAVTALVPIAQAIGELHRLGVCHGSLRLSSVLLDHVGAPIVAGFGRADLVGALPTEPGGRSLTPAQLAAEPRVARDLDDLVAVVHGVLSRVRQTGSGPVHAELLDWLDHVDRGELVDRFTGELAERIFALAPAAALRLDDPGLDRQPVDLPLRVVAPLEAGGECAERAMLRPRATMIGAEMIGAEMVGTKMTRIKMTGAGAIGVEGTRTRRGRRASDEGVGPIVTGRAISALSVLRERVGQSLAAVRRPVWIGGAAGLVALVVALTLLAPSSAGSGPSPVQATGRSSPVPTHARTSPASLAVTADDPVAASVALVAARTACIEALSVLCLDGVDQAGSAAIEADENLIRTVQQGGQKPAAIIADHAELVQRLGDSAMIRIIATPPGAPMSLLVVRGDAGWRIRDIAPG